MENLADTGGTPTQERQWRLGKCQKCQQIVDHVKTNVPSIKDSNGSYKGVAYLCPFCDTILGFQMDPLVLQKNLQKELLAGILKALGPRLNSGN
jgi:hypothetical protein